MKTLVTFCAEKIAALYLASDKSPYVTGTVHMVDCGLMS